MIELKHVTKRYGAKCAVNDISFTINKGEVLGFLGRNGAGKSTTMNMITGYISASEGQILLDGMDVLEQPREVKRRIGYLPEQPPLYMDMTVEEYLKFVCDIKEVRKKSQKAHLDDLYNLVRITDVRHRLIKNLSKGYRQRVGIAGALVGNPKVIIFDEPTVGLDPKQIIEIRNLIRGLGKQHTVVLSTHILQEVQAVCDRIVIINKGRIVADEKTENITRVIENNRRFNAKICGPQSQVLATLKTLPGITYAEALAERDGDAVTYMIESAPGVDIRKKLFFTLAERGWALIGLEALGLSLEDIFITVVNKSDEESAPTRYTRRTRSRARNSLEGQVASELVAEADRRREEASVLGLSDDADTDSDRSGGSDGN